MLKVDISSSYFRGGVLTVTYDLWRLKALPDYKTMATFLPILDLICIFVLVRGTGWIMMLTDIVIAPQWVSVRIPIGRVPIITRKLTHLGCFRIACLLTANSRSSESKRCPGHKSVILKNLVCMFLEMITRSQSVPWRADTNEHFY